MSDQIYKDGQYLNPDDRKLVDDKIKDMKLQELLDNLEYRQLQDRSRLADLQSRELKSAPLTGSADLIDRQRQQREDQEKKFEKERERYEADYQRANAMRSEVQENARRETLDPDKPKLTR